ncbi:DUF1764-domain-containing protein [Laetiporus sulphureus 93-53]|uniref:DUF1764-domain-containing protein n=1 Tax=Laetiporus sulphureus 93-53 TaxID=1314785 RepID=A0A165EEB6_9APHY|nr:DUF1764-domain-containing protein [Laetiporus sulphureus 93-53]KZT06859.1 DUF1764-domain-containing protein [Laetiporus sulphureus 93-53]
MPPSEIDDIFASKGKLVPASALPPESHADKKKKKKKSEKRKRELEDDTKNENPAKRRAPETVLDPSIRTPAAVSHRSDAKVHKSVKVSTKKPKLDKEEEERFKDSRGSGPRRKTEEGFAIYKVDELGITDEGGDTPLCPFDCQCYVCKIPHVPSMSSHVCKFLKRLDQICSTIVPWLRRVNVHPASILSLMHSASSFTRQDDHAYTMGGRSLLVCLQSI